MVTSESGCVGAELGNREWELHADAGWAEPEGRDDDTSEGSKEPLWAGPWVLPAPELSSRAKGGGGAMDRWWCWWCEDETRGPDFIVSERGCICSVCGLDSFEGGELGTMEGEDGGDSSKLPSEEGGLTQLPSP